LISAAPQRIELFVDLVEPPEDDFFDFFFASFMRRHPAEQLAYVLETVVGRHEAVSRSGGAASALIGAAPRGRVRPA
jgi:hypothetical protein